MRIDGRLAEEFKEVFVERLAIGQPGQCVGFTVIQQSDVVAEILDQSHQGHALVGRKAVREDQVDEVDRLVVIHDREHDAMGAVGEVVEHGGFFFAAAGKNGIAFERLAEFLVRYVGVAQPLSIGTVTGAGKDHGLPGAGVAAVNGQLLRTEQGP
ncbi:hypothetical protein SDC9_167885 [bioreactor metagenome]|uniref:Uncharacterized protein n=1 Tax=bioreactor metagenome TaxID=1076179 RepID=A0A645G2Z7_9ZZZZ